MSYELLEEIRRSLASPRVGDRLAALDRITRKSGRSTVRALDDPRAVALLIDALGDSSRRVQRAAARGLRPWVADDPSLLDSVLPAYATHSFDGSFSHAGLLDTRSGEIWVPRFAALKGHAALLREGNTDRYFKFEFFVTHQAPHWTGEAGNEGHLVLNIIPEWSYSRQRLVPEHDERGRGAALREQERFASTVIRFYRGMRLPYDVRVHRIIGGGGHHRRRELDVGRISGRSDESRHGS
jgi:hypothetical protein